MPLTYNESKYSIATVVWRVTTANFTAFMLILLHSFNCLLLFKSAIEKDKKSIFGISSDQGLFWKKTNSVYLGPKYYVNANSSGTIFTGFVIRRGNTWLWDNLIADLAVIEGRLFFSVLTRKQHHGVMDIVFLRGHQQKAVQHATVLYFEAWENTSKVCELLQHIACEVTRESMLAGEYTHVERRGERY